MKSKRQIRQQQRIRQKMYVSNWNLSEGKRDYDALNDQYASYYFNNRSVRKHLKNYTKVAKKEAPSSDLRRATFVMEQKLKKKQALTATKYANYSQNNSLSNSITKSRPKETRPGSLDRLITKKQQAGIDFSRQEQSEQRLPELSRPKVYRSSSPSDNLEQSQARRRAKYAQYLQRRKEQILQQANPP